MNFTLRRIALVLLSIALGAQAQSLVINEVMSANLGEAIDPSWNYGGWIELYNPSAQRVSLAGMTVTDHKGHAFKLTADHGSVPAHGFRNLWFGHNDKNFPTQVDFKLDVDGGTIALCKGGTTLDAVSYPEAVSRTSWGRTSDGADAWNYCAWPTPAATNAGALFAAEQLAAPEPDTNGGWLTGTLSFTVSLPDFEEDNNTVALHYTTDGTVPTSVSPRATLDASGTASFTVSENTVYRFRAISPDRLPSPVVTRSFITRSFTKTISGGWDWGDWGDWGGGWGGWDDTEETTTFTDFSLLSIVTDPAHLYDDMTGIYVDGNNGGWSFWRYANYYQDWDRPVSVEIFDPEGLPLLRQEADMSMAGGYSRMNTPKSFKLKTSKKFDGASFYPALAIFPEKPYARYKDLLVRVGGTDMLGRHQDNALQTLLRRSNLYVNTQAFRPVYVFFNGDYQETLLLREPSNKQYGYANYGYDTDFMDTLEESDITGVTLASGSWDAFLQLREAAARCASDDEAWQRVLQLLDVDEYASYFALELFLANEDWPQNNIKMFRDAADEGRFHVVVQDLDAAFHETGNTFERIDQYEFYPYAMAGRQENVLLTLFFHLLEREEFRRRFVDAFCIMAGSVFEPQAVESELASLHAEMASGYVERSDDLSDTFATLRALLSAAYAQKRVSYLRRWSRAGLTGAKTITATIAADSPTGLTLNGLPIPRAHFSGTLFLPAAVEASQQAGKRFVGWEKDGQLVSTEPALSLTADGTYTARYRADAQQAAPPVVVNELSATNTIYHSPRLKRSDWIEIYNTTDAPYDLAGCYISDDAANPHKHQLTDSRIVPPHGHIVLWADDHELPFKLSNADYAAVVLTAPDDTWADTFYYHAHTAQQSIGRWPDGGTDVYALDRPSIGSPNLLTAYAARLHFDPLIVGLDPLSLQPSEGTGPAPQSPDDAYDLLGRRTPGGARTGQGPIVVGHSLRLPPPNK